VGGVAGAFDRVRDGDDAIAAFFFGHKVKQGTQARYLPSFNKYRKGISDVFESDDVYLDSAEDDEIRARVWVQYAIHLYLVDGLRGRELNGALGAVKHYFDVALKETAFLSSTLVSSLMKSTARTTAETRQRAIESAEHAIYPLCDEIIDELKAQLWEVTKWEDFGGALKRMVYAAILLAIRRGFRVSNYVMVQPGGEDHCIRVEDVTFDVRSAVEGDDDEQVTASAMRGVDASRVVGFTTKVYTTKTGATAPTQVSQYTNRDTPEDSHLIDVLVECVQRTGVKEGDELFTVYRSYAPSRKSKGGKKAKSEGKVTRRVLQRKDVADSIKAGCEAAGLSRANFSTHSLRKTHATETGAPSSASAVDLNWAAPKPRANRSRANHYQFAAAAGSGAAVKPSRVSKKQLKAMLPATKKARAPVKNKARAPK
jgi:hypothetical protein